MPASTLRSVVHVLVLLFPAVRSSSLSFTQVLKLFQSGVLVMIRDLWNLVGNGVESYQIVAVHRLDRTSSANSRWFAKFLAGISEVQWPAGRRYRSLFWSVKWLLAGRHGISLWSAHFYLTVP
jgi:hypothetical protein